MERPSRRVWTDELLDGSGCALTGFGGRPKVVACMMDPLTEPPMIRDSDKPTNLRSRFGKFHKRSDLHLARKAWHLIMVSIMALGYIYLPSAFCAWILGVACVTFVSLDFLRQRYEALNRKLVRLFALFIRDHELHKWAGTSYLLVGVSLSMIFFDYGITLLSLLFLAVADPTASYFGIRYGTRKIVGPKSLEGALASFVVCTLITYVFCLKTGVFLDLLIPVSLLAGIAGSLSELIPVGKLDDNLTFPVLSSVMIWLLFNVMNLVSAYPAHW